MKGGLRAMMRDLQHRVLSELRSRAKNAIPTRGDALRGARVESGEIPGENHARIAEGDFQHTADVVRRLANAARDARLSEERPYGSFVWGADAHGNAWRAKW